MPNHVVLVENLKDWRPDFPCVQVITAKAYLSSQDCLKSRETCVINLCRSYRYLSTGYYCSLLAEPRRYKVIPSVKTITNLSSKAIYSLNVEDLDALVQKSFKKQQRGPEQNFELAIFFGRCEDPDMQDLARQIFDMFRCPLLKVEFRFQGKWHISTVKPTYLGTLDEFQKRLFIEALNSYLSKPWRTPRTKNTARYDLAILHNRREKMPPSNSAALQKFVKAGKKQGVDVELIERKDYGRLAEYDALFIRETTAIDHYTYRFAKKAQIEGMTVVDDPDSIVKCTNKVYLDELLTTHHINRPKTKVLQKANVESVQDEIDYPIVLKIPDGSFSRGVFKANNAREYKDITERLFKESDLILAQEFLYTQFDWRIGIFNHEPLYACQYFMSRAHWQVVKHESSGRAVEGGSKTWRVTDTPSEVVNTAIALARLIGDGLYGVDLKQTDTGVFVIEINDNPSIDAGIEDQLLGDELYARIISELVRRIETRRSA